jgi:uncharacterized membrane protein
MLVFKALHIVSMFGMVTVFLSGAFLYAFATIRRDPHLLAVYHRTARTARLPVIGLLALVAGVVFGLLTAATSSLDFFEGWLLAAYALVLLLFVTVLVVGRPIIELGDEAIEADVEGKSTDGVRRRMARTHPALFLAAMTAIFVAFILDMVLKPF